VATNDSSMRCADGGLSRHRHVCAFFNGPLRPTTVKCLIDHWTKMLRSIDRLVYRGAITSRTVLGGLHHQCSRI